MLFLMKKHQAIWNEENKKDAKVHRIGSNISHITANNILLRFSENLHIAIVLFFKKLTICVFLSMT